MRDRVIFIISLILVVAGISYLGYTAYQFFTRDGGDEPNGTVVEEPTPTDEDAQQGAEALQLVGDSNKEIIDSDVSRGEQVEITAEIQNPADGRVSTSFEGRTYQIEELYTFPDVDTAIPVDVQSVPVAVNANSSNTFTYTYSVDACGEYYIALASQEYWETGRGVASYGYFSVDCTFTQPTPSSGDDQTLNGTPTPSAEGEIAGDTAKGGESLTPTPTPTPEQADHLPKAGASENVMVAGVIALLLGFAYRIKLKW